MTPLAAVVFDLDGVLIDSEPLWQEAEVEVFGAVGVPLTAAMCVEACAVASSSPSVLIDAVLDRLGLAFPVVCSAERESFGKPHPGIYLRAADELGLGSSCIAVPDPSLRGDRRLGVADMVLEDLSGLPAPLDLL